MKISMMLPAKMTNILQTKKDFEEELEEDFGLTCFIYSASELCTTCNCRI